MVEGLTVEGFDILHAASGADALAASGYDLVLLDLGLPDMDDRNVCRQLRARTAVPIIMLTARAEEFDRVLGLELGADDYVTKPFSFRELVARIRAVARRMVPASGEAASGGVDLTAVQHIGPLSSDRRAHRVHLSGVEIALTAKEFDLLAFPATDTGAVHTCCSRWACPW